LPEKISESFSPPTQPFSVIPAQAGMTEKGRCAFDSHLDGGFSLFVVRVFPGSPLARG
jgi:hypothetical protein